METSQLRGSFQDNGDLLKKCLLQFPRRYNYEFSQATRVDLRRVLFFAASSRGQFLKHFFENTDESVLPTAWQHVLIPERYQHLESEGIYFLNKEKNDPHHPHRSCGRKFRKGETIYRCITCSKDESSGLCSHCFDEKAHEGHDIAKSVSVRGSGGVCDCGDHDAWKSDFLCKYHDVEETPIDDIPAAFRDSLFQSFQVALDYVVDVLSAASCSFSKDKPQDNESILKDAFRSSLDEERYFGTDWSCPKFELMLYNDQNKQYREAIDRIRLATRCTEQYAVMVADQVNAIGRAKVMSSSHIDELLDAQKILQSTGLPTCIKSAKNVFREEMCVEIIQWLAEISDGHILGNYNVIRDLLTMAFCRKWEWGVKIRNDAESSYSIGDLYRNKIPLVFKKTTISKNEADHWNLIEQPWNVDPELIQKCDYDASITSFEKGTVMHGSRFQYLLFFDTRLWKAFKTSLHGLFNSVLTTNQVFRPVICCQYVDIYPTLLELFFRYDRAPENSAMTNITSQIFTSTSNATMITEHGDLTRFLAAVFGFLTRSIVIHPVDADITLDLSPTAFKNRKIGQVFYDICCVLSKTEAYDKVLEPDFVNQVCDLLSLFQGRPTVRREALEHVEYETNDFGVYFNVYSLIVSIADTASKCIIKANTDPISVIELLFKRINQLIFPNDLNVLKMLSEKTDIGRPSCHEIDTIEGPINVIDFKVHKGTMSLLHPIHAFLACVVQYSRIKSLHFDLWKDQTLVANRHHVLDYPLRVIVLLSQIKVGLWVRNGMSIKTQLQIYRTTAIRESGFMRDFYIVQLMMVSEEPKFTMATFLSRWSLLPWLKEDFGNHEDYDQSSLLCMVEEFLLFMIQALIDVSFLTENEKISEERCINQIIHTLFFEPLTYSKLRTELPDFISQEKCFDIYLNKVSDFLPSKDKGHPGTYKIKDEYLEQLNPYYIHFTSNQRENAEKLVKDRLAKKANSKISDVYIPANTPILEGTLFNNLYQVTTSKIFTQFIKSTLKFINFDKLERSETLFDFVLHLIHISIEGKEKSYSFQFCENLFSELKVDDQHNEPFYYESVASLLYRLLKNDSYNSFHSKIRAIFKSLSNHTNSINEYLREQVKNFDPSILRDFSLDNSTRLTDFEKKKKFAQERRAKLMEKFKRQQSKFVEKNTTETGDVKDFDQDVEMEDIDDYDFDENNENHWKFPDHHCHLCQMPKESDEVIGVVCNIFKTSISRTIPFEDKYWTIRAFHEAKNMDSTDTSEQPHKTKLEETFEKLRKEVIIGPSFDARNPANVVNEVVSTSCGHAMHYSCYTRYIQDNKNRQYQITRTVPENFEDDEFICPLCKSIGNVFFPILWKDNRSNFKDFVRHGYSEDNSWYQCLMNFSTLPINYTQASLLIEELQNDVIAKLDIPFKHNFLRFDSDFGSSLSEAWKKVEEKINQKSAPKFNDNIAGLIASVIKGIEITKRGVSSNDGLILSQISHQHLTILRILFSYQEAYRLYKMWFALNSSSLNGQDKQIAVRIPLARLNFFISEKFFNSFGETDIFEYMVSLFPCFKVTSYSIYRLGYTYYIIQTIATFLSQLKEPFFANECSFFDLDFIKTDDTLLKELFQSLKLLRETHPVFDFVSDEVFDSVDFLKVFYTLLVKSLTVFLRKLALLAFGKCGNLKGTGLDEGIEKFQGLECDRLCELLNLPKLSEMLKRFNTEQTVESTKFKSFLNFVQVADHEIVFNKLEYPGMIKLIDLPDQIHEVFTKFLYPNKVFSEKLKHGLDPAICLSCGAILDLQKQAVLKGQALVKPGECNYHLQNECLSQIGIFLLAKHNSLLLLNKSGKGSFYAIPYTDEHGSLEIESKSPKVIKLDEDKLDMFTRKMWLNHEINNFITRKLEAVLDIGGWESF